jgi:polar amino acid transport system substrate-binding protein
MNMTARLALAVALLTMITSACGAGATPSSSSTAAQSTAVASVVPTVDPLAVIRAELAPTGTLRVAIVGKPPFVATKDASGQPHGLGVDFASLIAASLGVRSTVNVFEMPVDAFKASGQWDVLFVPANPDTAAVVALTQPYLLVPHTYLLSDPAIRTAADLDRPTVKVATEADHVPQVRAQLATAQIVTASNADALAMLKAGLVTAFAGGTFDLLDDLASLPGYRVLDGSFFTARLAIGVPKDRTSGLAWLKDFVEAKRSAGATQTLVDATGKRSLEVPPATY